jgi:DNA-binding PadR family transcriptional regulator
MQMPFHNGRRPQKERASTCDMGNLYRFVEPVVLFLLQRKRQSYGYELANDLHEFALTDSKIEASALYRTLRQLEHNNCVISKWDVKGSGPARRLYALTSRGRQHLEEWITVLDHISKSMTRLVEEARSKADAVDSKNGTTQLRQRLARHTHAGGGITASPASTSAQV